MFTRSPVQKLGDFTPRRCFSLLIGWHHLSPPPFVIPYVPRDWRSQSQNVDVGSATSVGSVVETRSLKRIL